ncbi:hypothetical protein ZHAS_00020269 [Anopheles sinensis]|uniref:Uncharacterized protein n=1 Tax=Anopheles sinensis TaxID=74873 RepID=A0A084WPC0_ANOSI|nr:hypothetical protein ZHAS_00020269 [Anopheles sinensis]
MSSPVFQPAQKTTCQRKSAGGESDDSVTDSKWNGLSDDDVDGDEHKNAEGSDYRALHQGPGQKFRPNEDPALRMTH